MRKRNRSRAPIVVAVALSSSSTVLGCGSGSGSAENAPGSLPYSGTYDSVDFVESQSVAYTATFTGEGDATFSQTVAFDSPAHSFPRTRVPLNFDERTFTFNCVTGSSAQIGDRSYEFLTVSLSGMKGTTGDTVPSAVSVGLSSRTPDNGGSSHRANWRAGDVNDPASPCKAQLTRFESNVDSQGFHAIQEGTIACSTPLAPSGPDGFEKNEAVGAVSVSTITFKVETHLSDLKKPDGA